MILSDRGRPPRGRPVAERRAIVCAIAILLAAVATIPFPPAAVAADAAPARALSLEELFGDNVVAKVNGYEIRQSQIDQAFRIYQSTVAAQGKRVPDQDRPIKEAVMLEEMIVTHLLTNSATRMDTSLAAAKADKIEKERMGTDGAQDHLSRQLKLLGLTPETYRQRLLAQAIAESVIERELNDVIQVTDEEVAAFYDQGIDLRVQLLQHEIASLSQKADTDPALLAKLRERDQSWRSNALARLEVPERVKVIHAIINTRVPPGEPPLSADQLAAKRRVAEDILRRAKAGADFTELVTQYSEDRNLSRTGGIYEVARDEPYPPEFTAACFSLEPGQLSDVVTSSAGYHVIKQLERIPARRKPLADIKLEIQAFLRNQKMRHHMPELFERVKANAQVEILSDTYKTILEKLGTGGQAASADEEEPPSPPLK